MASPVAPHAEPQQQPQPAWRHRQLAAAETPAPPKKSAESRRQRSRADDGDEPGAIDPLGVGALFVACAGLLCASLSWLCGFLVPLCLAALLAGVISLVQTIRSGRSRPTFPVAGTVVPGVILFVALVFPALLGPTYGTYKDQDYMDPTEIRRIPLAGIQADGGLEDPEWADASRSALRQGQLTLQVTDVAMEQVVITPVAGKPGKSRAALVVHLLVKQLPNANTPAGRQQQASGASLKDEHQPRLKDLSGKVYALLNVRAAEAGDNVRAAPGLAEGMTDCVLVFQPPGPAMGELRLEVPAAAWGGTGTFRFAIPTNMIRSTDSQR